MSEMKMSINVPLTAYWLIQGRFQIMSLLETTADGHKYLAVDRCPAGRNRILLDEVSESKSDESLGRMIREMRLPMLATFSGIAKDLGRTFFLWEEYLWPKLNETVTKSNLFNEKQAMLWIAEMAGTLKALLDNPTPVAVYRIPASSVMISPEGHLSLTGVRFDRAAAGAQEAAFAEIRQLARLLYFMLTGENWGSAAPRVTTLNPSVSAATEAFIDKCMGDYDPKFHNLEAFIQNIQPLGTSFFGRVLPHPKGAGERAIAKLIGLFTGSKLIA